MTLPTAVEITNWYLYGQATAPTPEELASDRWLRPANYTETYKISTTEYMAGPGRFATPGGIDYVRWFMEPDQSLRSRGLQWGKTYTKTDLFNIFGISSDGDIGHRITTINQMFYRDGADDFLERAYIWQTTAFMVQDGARFVIAADGTRSIENFALAPYSQEKDPENFDFKGGIGSWVANNWLEPRIDPSRIGRRVDFTFDGSMPTTTLTKADYDHLNQSAVSPDYINNLAYLNYNKETLTSRLWNSGATKFLDASGRPILYGTDNADSINASALERMPMLLPFASSGLTYVTGAGNDIIQAGATNDKLIGGRDNDRLYGGSGDDTYVYVAGDGNDTIIDSDAQGSVQVNGKALTGTDATSGFDSKKRQYWTDSNGVKYTKDGKNLLIQDGSLGSGTITIQNFDFAKGALGIKLKGQAKVALGTTGDTNPYVEGGSGDSSHAPLDLAESLGKSLKVFLNQPAQEGDAITLALAGGSGSNYSVVTGNDTLGFDSGNIRLELRAGQTEVGFAFLNTKDIDSDETLTLTATYVPEDGESAEAKLTINMDAVEEADEPATDTTINGDVVPDDTDPKKEGIQAKADAYGNPLGNPGAYGDILRGTVGSDHILSGADNDDVGSGAGDDWIEGEAGNDYLDGGAGNDRIEGGDGSDILYGDDGDDRLYAEAYVETAEAIAVGDGTGGGQKGDWLTGGEVDGKIVIGNFNIKKAVSANDDPNSRRWRDGISANWKWRMAA